MGIGSHSPTSPRNAGLVLLILSAAGCASSAPVRAVYPTAAELVAAPSPTSSSTRASPKRKDYEDYVDHSGWAKQGVYIGGNVVQNSEIGHDFDGDTVLVDEDGNAIVLPDLGSDQGFGVRLGYRFQKRALELGLERLYIDGEFLGFGVDTEVTYLNLHFKEYFLTKTPIQPFLLLGASSIWAELEDAAVNAAGTALRNADLVGHSGNVGGGIAVLPLPSIHLEASAIYHLSTITQASGFGNSSLIDGNVDMSGWIFGLAATFTL